MENPIKMDDLGGKPTIFGNPHLIFFGAISPGVFFDSYGCRPEPKEPGVGNMEG